MSDKLDQESHPHRFSVLVGVLFALPLFYLLSIGPVGAVCQKLNIPSLRPALRAFYYPVIWLHDHTALGQPLDVYLELWGVR